MPLFQSWTRPPSRRIYLILVSPVIGLLLVYLFFAFDTDAFTPKVVVTPISPQQKQATCPPLGGIEDVLVILKTGVTEALEKVPVHFQTTLRCIPNYVLFSDFEEEINGTRVIDVLGNVNETIKRTSPDFDLYNRIHEHGRSGLTPADLSRVPNTAFGMPDNPGWKLDKWKFLPMIDETLRVRDDANGTSSWRRTRTISGRISCSGWRNSIRPNLTTWVTRRRLALTSSVTAGRDLFCRARLCVERRTYEPKTLTGGTDIPGSSGPVTACWGSYSMTREYPCYGRGPCCSQILLPSLITFPRLIPKSRGVFLRCRITMWGRRIFKS